MSITSVFTIGPFVPCTPVCKILNTPVMSICLVKQNDETWVEKHQRFFLQRLQRFFLFLSRFLRFLTFFFYFVLERFFTSMLRRPHTHIGPILGERLPNMKCCQGSSVMQQLQ